MGSSYGKILALDLSTSCTGWAEFTYLDQVHDLSDYGRIKSSVAGLSKLNGINKTHAKMIKLIDQIVALVEEKKPDLLVVEEIAGSRSRLTQKTLDGFHWLLYDRLGEYWRDRIFLYDVTGLKGWRTNLQLKLSDADKLHNREAKKLNKKLSKGQQIPKIGPKHLSERFVNAQYNLGLSVDNDPTDGDVADATCMGHAFMRFHFKNAQI